MKKKILGLALCTTLLGGLLTGCGGNGTTGASTSTSNNKKPTEIVFWHSMGGKGGDAINALADKFNSSQSDVKVVAQYQGAYDDAINKLKSSAVGNAGPDVMQLYDIGTRWMIDSGYAVKMQDVINEDKYDTSKLEKNILDYYSIDNSLYSMPFNSSTPILYYNKNAFKEAGLDPQVAPKNFDEVLDFSKKLVVKDGDTVSRYGFAMQIYGWFFEQFMVKQQLDYANNGNGRKQGATAVEFDKNGGGLKILDTWKKNIDSGVIGNFGRNGDATTNAFVAGKTAMTLGSTASLTDIKTGVNGKFEVGTAFLPSINKEDKGGVSIGGGSLWIMDKKDKAKQKAAWQFIKFMVSKDSQVQWSKATGYFPITTEAYDLDEMKTHLEKNPEFKTAIEQLHASKDSSGALLGVFPEARASIEENIEKLLNGDIDSKKALENSANTINSAIEKYNKTNKK
jgi:sn-glycerol 3-phosphate transport system substrate-binding protein